MLAGKKTDQERPDLIMHLTNVKHYISHMQH